MGKSKGGGEEAARPTTSDVAAYVARGLAQEKREPGEVKVQRITEGVFAVSVTMHGESEPETYFLNTNESQALEPRG